MNNLTVKQRIEIYNQAIKGKGHTRVCQNFNSNSVIHIKNSDVANLIRKFNATGSVLTKEEMKNMIIKKKEFPQEDIDKIHHIINENPHSSIRRTSLKVDMNYSKVRTISPFVASVGKYSHYLSI